MSLYFLIPFIIGACGVLQGAINSEIALKWGLTNALIWNSILVLILTILLYFFGFFPGRINFSNVKLITLLLPGIFGFMIILGAPISIAKIGTLNTFLILIASQIITSGLYDQFMQNIAISWNRLLGALLVLVGAFLATK